MVAFALLACLGLVSAADGSDNADSLLMLVTQGDATGTAPHRITDTRVASHIAHALGVLPPAGPAEHMVTSGGGIFDKSKGNLVMNIDALGPELLREFGSSPAELIGTNADQIKVHSTGAQNCVESLITAMTGKQADEAGASVADVLAQSFEGRPLVVSASACQHQAASAGVNQVLTKTHPTWNAASVAWNPETNEFDSKSALNGELHLTESELKSTYTRMSKALPNAEFRDQKWFVSVPANGEDNVVTFDMSTEEDSDFFSELALAEHLMSQLRTSDTLQSLVQDDAPDMLVLAFSGFKGVVTKYGRHSPQVQAAIKVLQASLPGLIRSFQSLYGSQAAAQVLLRGASLDDMVEQQASRASRTLRQVRRLQEDKEPEMSVTEIALYQITLWSVILISFAVCLGSCSLYNMEYESDTLLFQKQKMD